MKRVPVSKLYPSQLKDEWKKLGRRAMRLWKASGGLDPEIDALFKRMDAVDRALDKHPRYRFTVRRRAPQA
jgi:hypothetical protein